MPYYKDHTPIISSGEVAVCSIYRIEGAKRGWWYVYIAIRGERRIRKSLKTTDRREAERKATQLYYKYRALKEEGIPLQDTSWRNLVDRYTKSKAYGSAVERRIKMLNIYFERYTSIKDITASNITNWAIWRKGFWTSKEGERYKRKQGTRGGRYQNNDIGETTLHFEANVLKSVLSFAKDRGLIQHIPEIHILQNRKTYRKQMLRHRRAAFTPEQHQRILRWLNWQYDKYIKAQKENRRGKYYALNDGREYYRRNILTNRRMHLWCHLLKASGIRCSEAKKLVWKNINIRYDDLNDVEILEIEITEKVSKVRMSRLVYVIDYATVEYGKSSLKAVLDSWKAISPYIEDDDLIFCNVNKNGDRKTLANMPTYFTTMIKKTFGKGEAKNFEPLIRDSEGKEYSSYSYRHMWATQKLKDGVNIYFVAEMLGSSPLMIRNHYGHLLTWEMTNEFYEKQAEHNARRKKRQDRAVLFFQKPEDAS